MELYHNNMSVCAQKVRLVLTEKELSPIEHHKKLRDGDTHTPEYLRLNPKGVVPTLVDNGHVIIETTIICEYLEDAYPAKPLMPTDPLGRAQVRRWTQLPDAALHQACSFVSTGIAWRRQILASGGAQLRNRPQKAAEGNAVLDLIEHGVKSEYFVRALLVFDNALSDMAAALTSRSWFAGTAYTLADVTMLPYAQRLAHLALDWMWEGDRRVIGDWFDRCRSRANYSGISNYLEPSYVELCTSEGETATPSLREILDRRVTA